MNNLDIYNKVATVPSEAQKTISAGRLKGMTDINPMWRIKVLTETFGVCGIGWKYTITNKEIVEGANGVLCAFVDIDLFVNVNGEWSEAIQGTGGSQFVSAEKNGMYTNDECYKMALTDAISVACKALGVGANVYWNEGATKYTAPKGKTTKAQPKQKTYREQLIAKLNELGIDVNEYAQKHGLSKNTTEDTYKDLLTDLG